MHIVSPIEGKPYRLRVLSNGGCMWDIAHGTPSKQEIQAHMDGVGPGVDPDRAGLIRAACRSHRPYVSHATALESRAGAYEGQTCVFIGAGYSAYGIGQRLEQFRQLPWLKIATLNRANNVVRDADFFCCYERLADPAWWRDTIPSRTTLLTAPLCTGLFHPSFGIGRNDAGDLAELWQGKNVLYSWIGDIRDADNPSWGCLEPLISSLTTATAALHALRVLGFSRILLVGFDFSVAEPKYDPAKGEVLSAKFYCDGMDVSQSYCAGFKHFPVQGSGGEVCLMNMYQLPHRDVMASVAEMVRDTGCDVIDCCERGIFSVDSDRIPRGNLEQIIDKEIAIRSGKKVPNGMVQASSECSPKPAPDHTGEQGAADIGRSPCVGRAVGIDSLRPAGGVAGDELPNRSSLVPACEHPLAGQQRTASCGA